MNFLIELKKFSAMKKIVSVTVYTEMVEIKGVYSKQISIFTGQDFITLF